MLEVKNLKKVYKTKGGVSVKALDDVSICYPDKGLVFLLGKSGSGKSTLLNVTGGLDKPDSGEIIVKGRSSKDFSQSDFDSYRNTFIGFIFQEYNILNEFNVEQNIALALQLQGKKADKASINEILKEVDLEGFNKRKPNTLSGGQKQRIAIARALIKKPEIIMADEPTGALDSNTGKQVFDTLKKLSKDKLIIVVSHDREFAELYGDRIIELKDGKILSDDSKSISTPKEVSENIRIIKEDTIDIKDASNLTDKDIKSLLNLIKAKNGEVIITSGDKNISNTKTAIHISDTGDGEVFNPTQEVVDTRVYTKEDSKFIKSKMPNSRAMKIGLSGLKTKPVRLIFTILLSTISFGMFGVVSSLMMYKESYSLSKALLESGYDTESISKYYKYKNKEIKVNNITKAESVEYSYNSQESTLIGKRDLEDLNKNGLDFAGVFNLCSGNSSYYGEKRFTFQGTSIQDSLDGLYSEPLNSLYGFTDCGQVYANRNFALKAGRYPKNSNEIAITEYIFDYLAAQPFDGISEYNDIIGKKYTLTAYLDLGSFKHEFTICGVYDVGEIPSKFNELKGEEKFTTEFRKLEESYEAYMGFSFHRLGFVSDDFYETYCPKDIEDVNVESSSCKGIDVDRMPIEYNVDEYCYHSYLSEENMRTPGLDVYDLDGNKITNLSLDEDECIAGPYLYRELFKYPKLRALINDFDLSFNHSAPNYPYYEYDETARDFYLEEDQKSLRGEESLFDAYINLNTGMYSDYTDEQKDIKILEDALNTYIFNQSKTIYERAASRGYMFDKLYTYYTYIDFYNLDDPTRNALQDFMDKIYEDRTSCTIEEWKMVDEFLKENFVKDVEPIQILNYMRSFYNDFEYYSSVYVSGYNASAFKKDFEEISSVYETYDHFESALRHDTMSEEIYQKAGSLIRTYAPYFWENDLNMDYNPDVKITVPNIKPELYFKNYLGKTGTLKVVGYIINTRVYADLGLSDKFIEKYASLEEYSYKTIKETDYVAPSDAKYNFAVSKTDFNQNQVATMITETSTYGFEMRDDISNSISFLTGMIADFKLPFTIIGAITGVLACLLLANFISTSISIKKREIGILRAVGARGSDVFKIFYTESAAIAFISFVLACVASFFGCFFINKFSIGEIGISLLNFNLLNIGLVFLITFVVSLAVTFVPVMLFSKKPPVDSIRSL